MAAVTKSALLAVTLFALRRSVNAFLRRVPRPKKGTEVINWRWLVGARPPRPHVAAAPLISFGPAPEGFLDHGLEFGVAQCAFLLKVGSDPIQVVRLYALL